MVICSSGDPHRQWRFAMLARQNTLGMRSAGNEDGCKRRKNKENSMYALTRLPPGPGCVLAGEVPEGYIAGAIATGLREVSIQPRNIPRGSWSAGRVACCFFCRCLGISRKRNLSAEQEIGRDKKGPLHVHRVLHDAPVTDLIHWVVSSALMFF